jgi:hypothetical protein
MPDIRASIPASNYTRGRGGKAIDTIVFHHIVGDAGAAIARFRQPGVEVSSTYIIGSDGQVYYTVDEANTPYTNGNYAWNQRSITIEHAGGGGGVPYTEAMYQASINLVRSIMARHRITNIKRHRDIVATACPGGLNVERIVNEAKGGNKVAKIPDADNYYWRYGQKGAERLRGRQLSREEFRRFIVGQEELRGFEILMDDPEADRAQQAQVVGQLAVKDNWQGQIYGLQAQVAELGKRPTQAQLDALVKQTNDLKVSADAAAATADEAVKKMQEATAKAQELQAQADADKTAGDSFLRQLGQFISKYLPGK